MNRGRLVALCFGNFAIGTGTMVVPGMLPVLADGLGVDIPAAGRLIAAFAVTLCVLTPLLAAWLSRVDRRALLAVLLLIYAAGHAWSASASSYTEVLLSRVASAVSAGLFTSQAAGVASLLAPPERRGSAVAMVFLGWSIAAVVGTPLSAWIGETLGWRAAFSMVSALSAVALVWIWVILPAGLRVPGIDGAAWRRLAAHGPVLLVIAVTAVHSWAQFTVFSYMTPIFKARLGAGPGMVAGLLALFGAAGILGNLITMRTLDRVGAPRIAALCLALMSTAHLVLLVTDYSLTGVIAGVTLWGLGCFAINSTQQARLLVTAPTLASVSVAFNSSAIYLGQAAGAETGGQVIARAGIEPLPWVSLPIFAAAIALSLLANRARSGRTAS